MPRRTLKHKRAIITGASSGIGRQLAIQLAKRGVKLYISARRKERLVGLQQEIVGEGGVCEWVAGDITDLQIQQALIERVTQCFGGLDLLINNAGVVAMGRFDQANSYRLRQVFEVNFFAAAELTRLAIPHLIVGNQPMIVNMGSVLGHRAVPLKSEYCASKFAMHGFSDAIRSELKPLGIDVLLVSPSTTDSEFFEAAIEDSTGQDWKRAGAMSSEKVARLAVSAIEKGKHEIILSAGGKSLVWLDRLLPTFTNHLIARHVKQ